MKNNKMTYIAIVDDQKALRHAITERLNALENFKVLFTAENGIDFLEKMVEARKTLEPDVVLMDIDMPKMNGIEALAQAKERFTKSKYLMLTIFDEDEKIFNAIRAGADGYLLKDEPIEKIQEAIVNLLNEQGAPMSPSIARRALNLLMHATVDVKDLNATDHSYEHYALTAREKEILTLLIDGLEYKEIALKTDVSHNTVRNHITKIYKKLHVTSRAQAAKLFRGK